MVAGTGADVLEIGGGVGDVAIELLKRGARRATNIELSPAYEPFAAELLRETGLADRVERRRGDIVEDPTAIEAARRILDERPIPIVMLTAYGQDELVARAVEAGVFGYLVKPFREQDLLPAIRAARARHEELLALREEAESLAEALAARKAIERAKGLLMEKEGLSEQDAFARLRKASQVSGRPLKVVAEAVVATLAED